MADFTQEELFIIGKALEDYYLKAGKKYRVGEDHSVATQEEILALRCKLVGVYRGNLGKWESNPLEIGLPDSPLLEIGKFYRVVQQGHKLDGKRVKLETIKPETDTGRTRAWVIDGIMNVDEVPAGSLVACS